MKAGQAIIFNNHLLHGSQKIKHQNEIGFYSLFHEFKNKT